MKLADGKERTIQHMMMTTFWHPDGTPMSAQQFMELLFGKLPEFFRPAALGRLVLSRGLAFSLPGIARGGVLAYTAVAWLKGGFVRNTLPAPLLREELSQLTGPPLTSRRSARGKRPDGRNRDRSGRPRSP
jgi:hypothetical protein